MPALFIAVSALVVFALGSLHLLYTFHGPKLLPRDPSLQSAMQAVSPQITRQTTMWRAWLGFNASHSTGAMLFGLVYGYLALWQSALLFSSWFLCAVGLIHLLGYVWIGSLLVQRAFSRRAAGGGALCHRGRPASIANRWLKHRASTVRPVRW